MWKKYMAPFHDQGKVLVSPGVSWGSPDVDGEGPNWLDQFMKACPDAECHVDEIALHWYGDASYTDVFQKYVTDMHTRYGNKNVWITEMRVDSGDASAFFSKVLPWMDSQSWIKGERKPLHRKHAI
jgi:O-glycosyl hydrolase